MGMIKNSVEALFCKAYNEYEFWAAKIVEEGWNPDYAITCAQYYGQMCGIANLIREVNGSSIYQDVIKEDFPEPIFMRPSN